MTIRLLSAACLFGFAASGIAQQAEPAVGPVITRGKLGPWGQLETWEIWLEPPTSQVLASGFLKEPAVWNLPPMPLSEAAAFLDQCGFTQEEIRALLDPERCLESEQGLTIQPPNDLIDSMPTEVRARLNQNLANWPGNRFMSKPFVLSRETIESLAATGHHGVPEEVISRANHLIYQRNGLNVFSDLPQIIRDLPAVETQIDFTQVLLRSKSLMGRVKVSSGADLDDFRRYWSAGTLNKGVLPILDAVVTGTDEEYLDLVHLLPPNPRRLLYTFARVSMSLSEKYPDCFWTSMNFFEPETSNRFLDFPFARLGDTTWTEVQLPLQFGDIIYIDKADGSDAVHACNFLADDLVFTKNGSSLMRPFIIDHLDSILQSYHQEGETRLRYFRHRNLVQSE